MYVVHRPPDVKRIFKIRIQQESLNVFMPMQERSSVFPFQAPKHFRKSDVYKKMMCKIFLFFCLLIFWGHVFPSSEYF